MSIKKEKNRIIFSRTFQASIEKVFDTTINDNHIDKLLFVELFHSILRWDFSHANILYKVDL